MKMLLPLFLFLCTSVSAQDLNIPTNEKGDIFYEDVQSIPGLNKDQLFNNARSWLVDVFKSSKDVLQYESKEDGELKGKGLTYIYSTGLATAKWPCYFTIMISMKDEKYRLQLYNFIYGDGDHPMEGVHEMYKKGKMKKSSASMLNDMDDSAKELIVGLKNAISKKRDDF